MTHTRSPSTPMQMLTATSRFRYSWTVSRRHPLINEVKMKKHLLFVAFTMLAAGTASAQGFLQVKTADGERSVAGTLFNNREPRLVELFGIKVEAELAGHMMYIVNEDAPGFIGRIGTLLGENAINIGTFNLGRREAGGEAVLLLSVDSEVPHDVLEQARKLPGVKRAMALAF